MMNGGLSASDVAVLSGSANRGNNDGMFGGEGGWLWIIVVFALLFGWGGNGRGFMGGGSGSDGSAYTDSAIQRGFDNQSVMNKLNGIEQGICSLGYDQLSQMNGINQNISQTGFGIQQAINADTIANMQNTNALSRQLSECCCETREAIQGVNFNMAQNTCALQNTMNNNTRDILENQNAGTRAILDYLCQDKISTLQAENQNLKLAASQANQNAVLQAAMSANTAEIIRRTGNDCPIPAYVVPNPNCCYGNGFGGFGFGGFNGFGDFRNGNGGCGCGCA